MSEQDRVRVTVISDEDLGRAVRDCMELLEELLSCAFGRPVDLYTMESDEETAYLVENAGREGVRWDVLPEELAREIIETTIAKLRRMRRNAVKSGRLSRSKVDTDE